MGRAPSTAESEVERIGRTSMRAPVLAGTGLQILSRLWSAAASAFVWSVLGRQLSEYSQGVYTDYFTMFVIAGTVLDFGAFSIAVREIAKSPEHEGEILRTAMLLRSVGALLCSLAIGVLAFLQEDDRLQWALLTLSILHLWSLAPATLGAYFHARVRFSALAIPLIVGSSVFAGQAWFLQAAGCAEPEPYLLAYGAGIVVQSLLTFLWGVRRVDLLGPVRAERLKQQFREMLPLGLSATAAVLYFQLDLLVVRRMAGPELLASYNQAFRLLNFAIIVPVTFGQALFPIVSRYARLHREQVLPITQRASFYLAAVMLPAAAMTPRLGPGVLRILFPNALPVADQCLSLLALAGVAIFLTYPQITALTAIGRQADYTRISLWVLPLKLGALALGFHLWALPGAALATVTVEWAVLALVSMRVRRHLGRTAFHLQLARPLGVALLVAVVCAWLPELRGIPCLAAALTLESGAVLLSGVLPFQLDARDSA